MDLIKRASFNGHLQWVICQFFSCFCFCFFRFSFSWFCFLLESNSVNQCRHISHLDADLPAISISATSIWQQIEQLGTVEQEEHDHREDDEHGHPLHQPRAPPPELLAQQ